MAEPENTGEETKNNPSDNPSTNDNPNDDKNKDQKPTETLSTSSLSEEQVNSIKSDITKDVAGKVSQEVSKNVIQRIGEALGLTKQEKEELPTDAKQLQKLIDQKVEEKFGQLSDEAEKTEEEEKTARQERIDGTIKNWHFQYDRLASLGKVPAIKNSTDLTDEGVVARRKIILGIGKIIDEMRKIDPNSNYIPSVSDVLIRFPSILKAPPGADLPISGNTAVRTDEDSFTYKKDIKGKSFQKIVDEAADV